MKYKNISIWIILPKTNFINIAKHVLYCSYVKWSVGFLIFICLLMIMIYIIQSLKNVKENITRIHSKRDQNNFAFVEAKSSHIQLLFSIWPISGMLFNFTSLCAYLPIFLDQGNNVLKFYNLYMRENVSWNRSKKAFPFHVKWNEPAIITRRIIF